MSIINKLKIENLDELNSRLTFLYREKLKIEFDRTSASEFNKTHLIKANRRNIARVLTFISLKKNEKL